MEKERPSLPTLVDDVKTHIASFLSINDAISLSYTCKAVYTIPLDPALHTIVLDRSPEQIVKFRNYLLSTQARPRFLRSLTLTKAVTLDMDYTSSAPATALSEILESATKLEHFSCSAFEAIIEASNDRMISALISLTGLMTLSLIGGTGRTMKMITGLNSLGIRELNLSTAGEVSLRDFFPALTKYQRLETLSFQGLFRSVPTTPMSISSLRAFSLINPGQVGLHTISSLFPNIQHLAIHTGRVNRDRTTVQVSTTSSWSHTLAEVHMDTIDLDIWPISCRVRWLDLDLIPPGLSQDALMAVERTKPCILSCAYRIDPDNLFWLRLPTIATDLRYLEARVLELSGHRKRYMLMHLARFPALTSIFLCLRAYYQPTDRDAELDAIARELAAQNRHLRFVGISLTDGRSILRDSEPMWDEERLGARWWAITRQHEDWLGEFEVSVKIISTEVGMKVRESMYKADFETNGWQERLSAFR